MIDLDVKTLGEGEIVADLRNANTGLRNVLRNELALIGEEIVSRAKSGAPVRTGGLRSRIVRYFGREMKRGPKGAKHMIPVDVQWKDGRIEFTVRPKGRVAHLVERGVNASFYQRTGRRGRDALRRGKHEIGPYAGEAMQGPEFRYRRTLKIAARPFFTPAVESVGGAAAVNARLQRVLDRFAARGE